MNRNGLLVGSACIGCIFIGLLIGKTQNPSSQKVAPVVVAALTTATPKPKPTPVPTPTPSAAQLRRIRDEKRRAERKLRIERQRQERAERRRLAAERERLAKEQAEAEVRAQREQEEAEARAVEAARTDGVVSLSEYNQIRSGMSYSEVIDIIGSGTEMSRSDMAGYTTVMYMWQNPGGANMNAMFQNGELIQKAQFGLE